MTFKIQEYLIEDLKQKYEVHELIPGDGWLVLHRPADHWIEFAVLSFGRGDSMDVYGKCFWHGRGCAALKEFRHSYFGEIDYDSDKSMDGYVFYLNLDLVIKASQKLKEYFD